jgi:hypothetical protein
MMGVEVPEACWATNKRQVINLWNCCIWLLNLSEFSIICFVGIWLMLFIIRDYVVLIDEGMSMEYSWHDIYMEKLKYSENHNWCFTDWGSDLGLCYVSMAVNGTAQHRVAILITWTSTGWIFNTRNSLFWGVSMCRFLHICWTCVRMSWCICLWVIKWNMTWLQGGSMFIWTDGVVVSLPVHCSSHTFCSINCWLLVWLPLLHFPWSFCFRGQNI